MKMQKPGLTETVFSTSSYKRNTSDRRHVYVQVHDNLRYALAPPVLVPLHPKILRTPYWDYDTTQNTKSTLGSKSATETAEKSHPGWAAGRGKRLGGGRRHTVEPPPRSGRRYRSDALPGHPREEAGGYHLHLALESEAGDGIVDVCTASGGREREGIETSGRETLREGETGEAFWGEENDNYTHGWIARRGLEFQGYLCHDTRHVDGIDLSSKKGLWFERLWVICSSSKTRKPNWKLSTHCWNAK